mmetsp:Transcript_12969/g.29484  ORF Transcript_12969/g.29484 Transcript_12969/m.29484 type:complete len:206 (-) Transcript_12969:72-689(-)|eukprot:CAMPEP_0197891872 /NCGR_PEP_ID=MMETSP1439-20131203/29843_1 /TAXON_ID=66791 /ORGANISM="Gonyaulax spinifera, Strain CCMP409" /LENGTH=205 /DNA_ID=CAMNT_0043512009 /DNA_START=58 /DNA_END=675 /DNA_ORIENTATION=-
MAPRLLALCLAIVLPARGLHRDHPERRGDEASNTPVQENLKGIVRSMIEYQQAEISKNSVVMAGNRFLKQANCNDTDFQLFSRTDSERAIEACAIMALDIFNDKNMPASKKRMNTESFVGCAKKHTGIQATCLSCFGAQIAYSEEHQCYSCFGDMCGSKCMTCMDQGRRAFGRCAGWAYPASVVCADPDWPANKTVHFEQGKTTK